MRTLHGVRMVGLGLLLPGAARAQVLPNLGLEPGLNHGQPLVLWSKTVPPGGRLDFDSTVFRQGRGSLRLTLAPTTGPARPAYLGTGLAPPDSARGQVLTVSAWVRTQDWRGRLYLEAGTTTLTVAGFSYDRAQAADSLPGTTTWRQLTLRLPVKMAAYGLWLGVRAQGSGRVWVDDWQLTTQHHRLAEPAAPATEALLLPPAEALVPNWDFERLPPRLARPAAATATVALDSLAPQHGRRALRVERHCAPSQPAPAVYLGTLPLDPRDGGKTLRVAGYWRQAGAAAAGAAPWFGVRLLTSGPQDPDHWRPDTLGIRRLAAAPGPRWAPFAFDIPLQLLVSVAEERVTKCAVSISLFLPHAQPVELDNLAFALDGKPYAPTGPPLPPPPSAAETAWLRTAARPLRLATPATAAPDLAALGTTLAPARLVALGEVTHGAQELFALHGQLARYLLGQRGFGGLLLEASPAGCAAVDAYLHTGQGDPTRLLAALGEGWNTPEVLALVRWLRESQRQHPATPLLLAGFDVRQPEQALAYLEQLTEPDDDFTLARLREVARLLAAFPHPAPDDPDLPRHPDQPQDSLLAPLRRVLTEIGAGLDARAQMRGRANQLRALDRYHYYLRLVEQGATWRRLLAPDLAFNYRQACQAANVQYLSQQAATAGAGHLVLWANNHSVAKFLSVSEHPMGQWLYGALGAGYQALGAVLGQGSYAARSPTGQWAPAPLAAARPGAYEAWLSTGPPAFWLPLGPLALRDDTAWLLQEQLLRDLGPAATRNHYQLHNLRGEFDTVVFLRDATPTQRLP